MCVCVESLGPFPCPPPSPLLQLVIARGEVPVQVLELLNVLLHLIKLVQKVLLQ